MKKILKIFNALIICPRFCPFPVIYTSSINIKIFIGLHEETTPYLAALAKRILSIPL